ncbi:MULTISPECIES: hydroxyisourate hydrolase [unclassified Carboxylicivirga]|uniref:hydroxyisourate hydrolase n=1 Tax=Carboxylicivirga TaxID=1628153 RepID=UPI003D347319
MKKYGIIIVLTLFGFLTHTLMNAQDKVHQLSSHILDVTEGKPAPNVKISLYKQDNNGIWKEVDERVTDFLLMREGEYNHGIYKLRYHTKSYFKGLDKDTFYPFIEVVFEIVDDTHYHVPITLSAYGYSTYRGN